MRKHNRAHGVVRCSFVSVASLYALCLYGNEVKRRKSESGVRAAEDGYKKCKADKWIFARVIHNRYQSVGQPPEFVASQLTLSA